MKVLLLLVSSFIIHFSLSSSKEQNIVADYKIIGGYRLYVDVEGYGTNYYQINQQIDGSYLYFSSEIPRQNITIGKENITISSKNYERELLNCDIRFGIISESLTFYYLPINPPANPLYRGISLSLTPRNESFSLIHQLKKKGLIKKLIYTLGPSSNDDGKLYFGDVPLKITTNQYHYRYNIKGNRWEIGFDSVYFIDENGHKVHSYYNNKYNHVLFQTNYESIYVPLDYLTFLEHSIFKSFFENKICSYITLLLLGVKTIECVSEPTIKVEEELPISINFVIEGRVFSLNISDFSYKYYTSDNHIVFRIPLYSSLDENEKDYWQLGSELLKRYTISFNYEERSITFHSNIPLEVINDNAIIKRILIILSFFLFINILFNSLRIKMNIKNQKNEIV